MSAQHNDKLVLAYWGIRGLAQPMRLLLHFAQVSFEEKTYEKGDDWFGEKFSLGLAFPNLPYLVDGKHKLTQSTAIIRYLGRKFNLDGKTEDELVRMDLMFSQIIDCRSAFVEMCYSKDEAFTTKKATFLTKTWPTNAKMMNDFLEGHEYVAGSHVTYVDFVLYELVDQMNYFNKEAVAPYKNLVDFHARIEALPTLASYIKHVHDSKIPINGYMASFR